MRRELRIEKKKGLMIEYQEERGSLRTSDDMSPNHNNLLCFISNERSNDRLVRKYYRAFGGTALLSLVLEEERFDYN